MGQTQTTCGHILACLALSCALALHGCAREGTRWVQNPTTNDVLELAPSPDADSLAPPDASAQDIADALPADLLDISADMPHDQTAETSPDTSAQDIQDQNDGTSQDADTADGILDIADSTSPDTADAQPQDVVADILNTFADVTLLGASAPDDTHVVLSFDGEPQSDMSLPQLSLHVESDFGDLAVSKAAWDSSAYTLTLTTGRQKLGVQYQVSIGSAGSTTGLLQASFLSADTKVFWATDFDDPNMDDMQVPAHRIFVGEHTVAYSMDGYQFDGAEAASLEFDTLIYPLLTEAFLQPLDFDGNGRIVLLYTDSDDYGGYFSPVNQWSNLFAMMGGAKSNEMEILYISGWMGAGYFGQVTPHEFQHLLYYCRHQMKDNVHWDYHDEGLAESAVRLVYGNNDMASMYYQYDPQSLISMGLSMVNWQWGLYENYAIAYVFWAWVAGQLGGPEAFKLIFDIEYGGPEQVSEFLQEHLGLDLHEAVLAMMAAVRLQAPDGLHSFNGMISLDPNGGPRLPAGTPSVQLEPFGGIFVPVAEAEVEEPGGKGPNVQFGGIAQAGGFDTATPFETTAGWLVAYNGNWNYWDWTPESTGTLPQAVAPQPVVQRAKLYPGDAHAAATSAAWDSPPPRNPFRPEQWREWRDAHK